MAHPDMQESGDITPSRDDLAVVCAYVLAGGTWVPGKAVDQSKESHFLAARVVVDTDEDEAFIELHDFPRTAVLEFVVRLRAESRLVRLSGDRDKRSHFYELEKAAGPDVLAFQFADRASADRFGAAVRRAANAAAERRASFSEGDVLRRRCVEAGFDERDVREALAARRRGAEGISARLRSTPGGTASAARAAKSGGEEPSLTRRPKRRASSAGRLVYNAQEPPSLEASGPPTRGAAARPRAF
mmetsp:Transcript_6427/g.19891  ORF Transcript_6427/g.19891 Transcript_6427/m.19891 type:complete len:244 (+) Transcript_6427:183-914(+)